MHVRHREVGIQVRGDLIVVQRLTVGTSGIATQREHGHAGGVLVGRERQVFDGAGDRADRDAGFGPERPWGLVNLPHDEMPPGSMGMDSGWFSLFLDAFLESHAATELPIWRVLRSEAGGGRVPLTPEMGWDDAWAKVKEKKHLLER